MVPSCPSFKCYPQLICILVHYSRHRDRRKSRQGWRRHFCLRQKHLAGQEHGLQPGQGEVWTYSILGEEKVLCSGFGRSSHPYKLPSSQFKHSTLVSISINTLLHPPDHFSPVSIISVLSSGKRTSPCCLPVSGPGPCSAPLTTTH